MTTVDRLFEEASKLTHEERAELVDRICGIDDAWASPEIRDAWMAEIDRREAELEAGGRTLSREEFAAKAQELLDRA